jgi:protein CpxP
MQGTQRRGAPPALPVGSAARGFTQLYAAEKTAQPAFATMAPSTKRDSSGNFQRNHQPHSSTYRKENSMGQKRQEDASQPAPGTPGRRRFWKRAGIVAVVGATLTGLGAAVFAHGGPGGGWGGNGGWHSRHNVSPELRAKRVDLMIETMLDGVDVSAEQKTRINAIVKATMQEMQPLRAQRFEARREAMAILTQPTVDRAKIEAFRVEKLNLADAASQRLTQGIADVAEVLTAEQRAALAEKFSHRRGRRDR